MSLRREEAELRRVLELSTQQISSVARLPPHSLSSASTSDSRDLELRPAQPTHYATPHPPYQTPQSRQQGMDGLLSPSPPNDLGLAHELGLTPSAAPADVFAYYPLETPGSHISTYPSAGTTDTSPASVINTFPQTLTTPAPAPRAASRVEVLIPTTRVERPIEKQSSVDPIDSLGGRDLSPPPPENLVLVDASRSSGPSTSGPTTAMHSSSGVSAETGDPGRRSSRVRENQEKEEETKRKKADARKEQKRKRDEEKARLQEAERAQQLADAEDGGEYVPGRPEKKKKTERKRPSQTKASQTKAAQAKASQAKSDKSSQKSRASASQEEPSSLKGPTSLPDSGRLSSVAEEEPRAPNSSAPSEAANTASKKSTPDEPKSPQRPVEKPPAKKRGASKKASASAAKDPESSAPAPSSASEPEPQSSPVKTVDPPASKSPVKTAPPQPSTPRTPLQPSRNTPGSARGGTPINWKTSRNDLTSVLSKFPGAKRTGMSRRTRITSLHTTIGPGAKALPPPPPKTRKKVVSEDEDSDAEGNVKVGSREWLMMED